MGEMQRAALVGDQPVVGDVAGPLLAPSRCSDTQLLGSLRERQGVSETGALSDMLLHVG